MSYKKILEISQKGLVLLTLLTTLLSVGGIPWLLPVPEAKAAVVLYGCGAGNTEPCFWIPPNGQVVGALSGPLPLFSFNLDGDGVLTLSSITVNLVDPANSTTTASDIAAIEVYKRTSWGTGGGMYNFPALDRVGQQTTINAFSSGVSANNIISTGTTPIPDNQYDAEYYVAVRTSANWSGTGGQDDQIRYTLPANWITLSDSSHLGSQFSGQPATDIYYATAPQGWSGNEFSVTGIDYLGTDTSGNHEVEVRFSNDVNATAGTTVSNYSISGTNPTSASFMGPMMVSLTFASSVTITPNQTQLTIDKDIQDWMGNVLDPTSDVIMVIMGGGGGGGGALVLISEAMIGTAASGLEEFVELYNMSGSVINFSNMPGYIWVVTSSGGGIVHTKIADLTSGTVPANGYYLVASSQYSTISPSADLTFDATMAGCSATEGCLRPNSGVYISTSTSQDVAVMDKLGWGSATGQMSNGPAKCSSGDPESCTVANDGKSLERKANYSSTASSMVTGGADAGNGNSYMSYDSMYDFVQIPAASVVPQSSTSTAETPGGAGYGGNNNYPFINHNPIFMAPAGQDLIAIADFMDDSGQIAASNVKLYYRFHDDDGNPANGIVPETTWNPASGTRVSTGSDSFRFTIPSATLDANKDLDYFLRAYDGTNYTCLPPGTSGTTATCNASTNLIPSTVTPWYVNVSSSAGTGVISGTVQDSSGNPIPNVLVYTEGMPFTNTTNTSGSFLLTGLPDGVYDIRAQGGSYTVAGTTANYIEGGIFGIYLNTNNPSSSGNVITLVQGVVENRGGTSADTENPWVKWSAPNDNMMGFPKHENLVVVFDKAMQRSTMTGGTATTDNIYLVDSSGSVVAGSVIYCPDDNCYVNGASTSSTTRSSYPNTPSAGMDPYLLLYDPSTDLSTGSSYTLVIKDTVLGSNGKRLMGNRSAGGHSVQFTVAMDFMGTGGTQGGDYANYSFGSGASYPPYVVGTTPGSGRFDVALNTNIYITFNEPMSSSSINTTNIKLYSVSNPYTSQESETVFTYTVSQNTGGNIAIIDPATNLSANAHYRVKVLSNCTSANGTPMSPADNAEQFRIDFETGSSTDTTGPTIAGTYPTNNSTNIPNNLPAVTVGFSEGMNPSTVNAMTVKLKSGTSVVAGTVDYDVGAREARIMPTNALRPGATYTIFVSSGSAGVKDAVGNALTSDYEATFTTDSTADATAPYIEFARCDDFSCSITYSEPMNSARADDTANFNYSVLRPANYSIATANVSNARGEYDQMNNTVRLENVTGLAANDNFTITVQNVRDKAGNTIGTPNTFSGRAESSMGTGGMMGPGGPGPMMGPATMMDASGTQFGGAGFVAGAGMTTSMGGSMGFDFGGQWMEPINAMPMNMMAGITTNYMIEFKADSVIPSGGTIKITFPTGTDVSAASAVPTTKSMANKDLSGPMDNVTVTISAVANNPTARTVTVTTAGGDIPANAFVRFDLAGIKNPTVPKDFDSSGYTADIKTFNASGVLLQSETTMPYFISAAGSYTLTGTITATDATGGTATVYAGSWQTGPLEDTVTFSAGSGTYEFSGLPAGEYNLFTEPTLTLTAAGGNQDYTGYMRPDPIWVNSSNTALCSGTTCTKNFSFTKQDTSNAYQLTVYIVGDFSGLPASDSEIDIFAGGPNGNTVKTVDLNQANCTGTSCSSNLYLPSAGEWWVGMGPAMPHGGMMMGPAPMPSWMPPGNVIVKVSGTFGSPSWEEGSGTSNDGRITFTVSVASNQIIGYVVDSSGTAISNVEVNAHRTQGDFGMPAFAKTDTNGKFTLKVTTGMYEVNAWMPGLPWSPGRVVDVRANSSNTDGNTTADVYKDNGTTLIVDATSGYNSSSPEQELLIKIDKSSTTISGKVLDDSDKPVAYAPVWAFSSTTGENRPSGTDSSGNYTIYVPNGSWNVESFIPGIGNISYANNPVSVSGSNRSDINIRPSSSVSLVTISGRVYLDSNNNGSYDSGTDTAVSNASVWVDRGNYHNQTNTGSTGEFRFRVPANTGYSLKCWTPEYGDLDPVTNLSVSSDVSRNFVISAANTHTLTVNFTGSTNLSSGTDGFIDIFDPVAHKGNHKFIDDMSTVSSTTMTVKQGTNYEIHVHIPGIGDISPSGCASDSDCTAGAGGMPDIWSITADKSVTIDLTALGDLYTFSVTVQDGSSNNLSDAFVWLGGSSFHSGNPTNSSGVATIKVPAGTYKLGGDKPGYTGPAPISVVAGGSNDNLSTVCGTYTAGTKTCAKTITLTSNPYTLSGYIFADADADSSYDSGEGIAHAWVWADKVASLTDFSFAGGWTGTETDADGSYKLSISDGYWLVRAVSDAYQETTYKDANGARAAIQINGASQSGKNIALNSRTGYSAIQPKSAPITPASGGTIDDSANSGVKLTVPPSAMGTDTSSGTVNVQKTYSVPSTDGIQPVGAGVEISASNSSGQAVTSLSGSATIEVSYSESAIPAGVSESNLVLAYFDDSSGEWVEVPATVDTTNNKITGSTTHLSRYIVGSSADSGAPTQPGTPTATSTSSSSVTFSWTASTDSETSVSGYQILRSTDGTNWSTVGSTDPWSTGSYVSSALNSGTSYTNSSLSAGTTYYYHVVAFDTAGNHSAASGSLTVTTSTGGGGGVSPAVTQPTATAPSTATGQVTAKSGEGGSTSLTNTAGGSVKLTVPAASITADTDFLIEVVSETQVAVAPSGYSIASNQVYDFTATAEGSAVSSFATSLNITFTYTDDQIEDLDEDSLQVHYYDSDANEWVALDTTLDTANNTATVSVIHLTTFALMGQSEAEGEEEEEEVKKPIAEMTVEELKAEITRIQALIVSLQAQLAELLGVKPEGCTIASFERNLQQEMVGDDVKCLQIVLNSSSDTKLAESGVGSPGKETNYFGPLTKSAVIKFQEKYAQDILAPLGLTAGTGYAGSNTRGKLNELLGQ